MTKSKPEQTKPGTQKLPQKLPEIPAVQDMITPVTMTESKPGQTEPGTQNLPTFPTIQQMKTWNREKVYQWIQQRDPDLLRGNSLRSFTKAAIGGRAFLVFSIEDFKTYGLPLADAAALKDLADEVKEKSKLSNQTAGPKRKGDEIDALESSTAPKKPRQEVPLSRLATKANERRKRIREIITDINGPSDQHSNSVEPADPLPGAVDQLSDPAFERILPFPFVGFKAPTRLKLIEGNWQYAGRTKFKELLQEFRKVQRSENYTTLWLYGTQGYGKSHLLAALVCYLAAQKERVIYIPDCRSLLEGAVQYFRAAMLFAWADDTATQQAIMALKNLEEINEFFTSRGESGCKCIFVIDQMNALKSGPIEQKQREDLSEKIKSFAFYHVKVYSSSANNADYHRQAQNENQHILLPVYGGLDRAEMDQWWKRHPRIDKAGYKESDVEDATGKIPLFLDKCLVGEKIDLTVDGLRDIYHKASAFVQHVRTKTRGAEFEWQWYTEAVKACISHQQVPTGWTGHLDLIDHRYFYRRDKDIGGITCGLIRDAVTEQLLMWEVNFADTKFLASLDDFIANPPVTGFIIESAILSSIRSHGLAIGAGIGHPMKVRLFANSFDIDMDIIGEPVLYCPKRFNEEAIDGIIVLIKPDKPMKKKQPKKYVEKAKKNAKKDKEESEGDKEESEEDNREENEEDNKEDNKKKKKEDMKQKPKLFMFPLQITLALQTHKDSHAQFFEHYYDKWTKGFSAFDVVPQFVWITPDRHDTVTHKAKPDKWPQHTERFIHLGVVNQMVWQKYQNAKRAADEA